MIGQQQENKVDQLNNGTCYEKNEIANQDENAAEGSNFVGEVEISDITRTIDTTTISDKKPIALSDIIGEFGYYQFIITLLAFFRYICLALMTNSGALIAPDQDFKCVVPSYIANASIIRPSSQNETKSLDEFLTNRCEFDYFKLDNNSQISFRYECSNFAFLPSINGQPLTINNDTGITLTNTFNLVCDRKPLRSTFSSIVYMGVLFSVIWGSISDRYGRKLTWRICFIWSFVFGSLSFVANDFLTFTIARVLCTFGDAGLVVSLLLVVIETLGNKYRGTICVIIYTGWSMGVMVSPWAIEYFKNFKHLMLFTVMCHVFTLPWMFWTIGESIRWLLVEGHFKEAKCELIRVNSWNGKTTTSENENLDNIYLRKFNLMKMRYIPLANRRRDKKAIKEAEWSKLKYFLMIIFGGLSKIRNLFLSKELTFVTLSTALITFNGELFYMVTILLNSDIGDIKLNYLIGGLMEILASIIAISMISSLSRKLSLTITLVTISCSSFLLATTHQFQTLAVWILNFEKFSVSTLTSLIYVVITELYPTNLRQTGIGLTGLLGGSGAIIGPFIREELVDYIGLTNVLYLLSAIPLLSSLTIMYLRETRGVELSDDIDELEEFSSDNNDNNSNHNNQNERVLDS